jgi:hypothetical protein
MNRAISVVLFLIIVAVVAFLGLLALSWHDAYVGANKVFGSAGPVHVSLVSIHPSKTHGLWIFWRMRFSKTYQHMPGDVALWYLSPFRHVDFTKDR